ncbi:MAG TPA: DUF998 domain-containing protein [Acidimicrobiales bacterium]|nr:DUF998 domain-containing protein [Acidimicrobiales bacterium]
MPEHPRPTADQVSSGISIRLVLGSLAGPLFVGSFTAIGARRAGYDWRRHAVSSLATGRPGWFQRANFVLTGLLYLLAASGLACCPRRVVGSRAVPILIGAAGAGLIGSGVFVTDPVAGFPPASSAESGAGIAAPKKSSQSRSGALHNLCAIPVFVGIPVAGVLSAVSAAGHKEYRWAGFSAGSSLAMVGSLVLFGAAFGGTPRLAPNGGLFQRVSIAAVFGWLSALSLRGLASPPGSCSPRSRA